MLKRYQILRMDSATGKWAFVAHGARYSKQEAESFCASCKDKTRILLCGKESE